MHSKALRTCTVQHCCREDYLLYKYSALYLHRLIGFQTGSKRETIDWLETWWTIKTQTLSTQYCLLFIQIQNLSK